MEAEGFLDKIRPPRLEDAGLEDCALPPESIAEAFLKAATAVGSRATAIFSVSDDEEGGANCVNDPSPTLGESPDALVGIAPETETPGGCAAVKGAGAPVPDFTRDDVTIGGVGGTEAAADKVVGGADVPEDRKACVDGLQGLNIGDKSENLKDKEDEKDREIPILAEGYV